MPLEFNLDITDPSSLYNIYFSSRVNTSHLERQYIDLTMTLISPSNDTSENNISLPIAHEPYSIGETKVVEIIRNGEINDIEWLYLHNTSISQSGKWKILIDINNKEVFSKALLGFGIKYERQR